MSHGRTERQDTLDSLKDDALGWLNSELVRLRSFLFNIDSFIAVPTYADLQFEVLVHGLRYDLFRHFSLESSVLLPALRLASHMDDEIETAIDIMTENHRQLSSQIRRILPPIEALRLSQKPLCSDHRLCGLLEELAMRGRRHIAITTAVILPIARLRFNQKDVESFATNAARHMGLV